MAQRARSHEQSPTSALGYCCIVLTNMFPPQILFPLVSECTLEKGLLFFGGDNTSGDIDRQELCSICSDCLEFKVDKCVDFVTLYDLVFSKNDMWNLSAL